MTLQWNVLIGDGNTDINSTEQFSDKMNKELQKSSVKQSTHTTKHGHVQLENVTRKQNSLEVLSQKKLYNDVRRLMFL